MFADAQQLLTKMKQDGSLRAVGCVAFYQAQSNGDDIKLYDELGSSIATLYGLRQQVGSQSIMISGLVSGIFIFSFFSYFKSRFAVFFGKAPRSAVVSQLDVS